MLAGMAPVRAETLADALVDVYNSSGLLQQNRALLRAADEDVGRAVSALRPILDWTADITHSFSDSSRDGFSLSQDATDANLGVTGSLLLYDFGETRFGIRAAKQTVLATRQALLSIEQQVLLRGVRAYMNVIRNRELVAVRVNNLELLRQELRAARDRFQVGEVTRTDVAQAESRVAAAESGLAAARGDLIRAEEEFRSAASRPPGVFQTPTQMPRLGEDVEAARKVALRRHPDLLKARYDVATAEQNILVAEAVMKPDLALIGRYSVGESLENSDDVQSGSVGITLSGPIYQGGLLSAELRRAIAQRDAQRGQLHLARLQVVQDVGNAYADLRAAEASRKASREEVRAATIAFEGAREEARLGARTTLDVLDNEQDLLDARANLISANADVVIAAYSILAAIGELTVETLNLDVARYDPAAYYGLAKGAPTALSERGRKLDQVLRALGRQ